MSVLEETGQLPVPRQRWTLCVACVSAVTAEVRRTGLRTPLRVRIALGIVAAERAPRRCSRPWHATYWKRMPESQVDRLVNRAVVLLFPAPALLFVLLATLAAAWR
jgi:hypothetical protein